MQAAWACAAVDREESAAHTHREAIERVGREVASDPPLRAAR
jgi:hypothetical protein